MKDPFHETIAAIEPYRCGSVGIRLAEERVNTILGTPTAIRGVVETAAITADEAQDLIGSDIAQTGSSLAAAILLRDDIEAAYAAVCLRQLSRAGVSDALAPELEQARQTLARFSADVDELAERHITAWEEWRATSDAIGLLGDWTPPSDTTAGWWGRLAWSSRLPSWADRAAWAALTHADAGVFHSALRLAGALLRSAETTTEVWLEVRRLVREFLAIHGADPFARAARDVAEDASQVFAGLADEDLAKTPAAELYAVLRRVDDVASVLRATAAALRATDLDAETVAALDAARIELIASLRALEQQAAPWVAPSPRASPERANSLRYGYAPR